MTSSGISSHVRPTEMSELVGLDNIKALINLDIEGSKALKQPIPSYIIGGPAGTGKSTIATIISGMTGGSVVKYIGSDLKNGESVYDIASVAKDNDVVYIEEAHTIGKSAQVILLEWIENFQLLGGGAAGMSAPKTCFVLPTTNVGKLSKPLRERCRIISTSYYTVPSLERILLKAGEKCGIDLGTDVEALSLLAKSSRGTPRKAVLHRLDLLRKVMAVYNLPYSLETVIKTLQINNINEWGLESGDIKYLEVIYEKMIGNRNRPVSKKIIQQCTGLDEDVIDNIIESYLQQINAVRITGQGRLITAFGCELIDEDPLDMNSLDRMAFNMIDLDELKVLVEDPEICSGGMKVVSEKIGLRYGPDNAMLKSALERIGYTCKRRVGIRRITD